MTTIAGRDAEIKGERKARKPVHWWFRFRHWWRKTPRADGFIYLQEVDSVEADQGDTS